MSTTSRMLTTVAEFDVPVRRPFNFRYTFWKPSHFNTGLEFHTSSTSWRTLVCDGGGQVGLRFDWDGMRVLVKVFGRRRLSSGQVSSLKERITRSYGLEEDISEFLSLASACPATARAVRAMRGMRMSCPESLFEIAVLAVLLQNTTIARTEQMLRLLLARFGTIVRFDGVELKCFFSPRKLAGASEDELRNSCRVGYRAPTISAIAKHFAAGRDKWPSSKWQSPTAEVQLRSELVEIRGIGPFTANVIASHALRRMDEPALDVWSTRIVGARYGMPEVNREAVQAQLRADYPAFEALALLYMIEDDYRKTPLVPLASI